MSHQSQENSASESETIALCEADIARFTAERDECVRKARELMAAEDHEAGVTHAGEIFRLRQNKLRLEVEITLCANKINRIRLGCTESDAAPRANGFPF